MKRRVISHTRIGEMFYQANYTGQEDHLGDEMFEIVQMKNGVVIDRATFSPFLTGIEEAIDDIHYNYMSKQ